ncbi:MAG: thiamine-phosphate kinase [Vicinamibacterales bacterium]
MTVSDLGEHELLALIRARLPAPAGDVQVGIGDDAAVVAAGRNTRIVLTTDAQVEGVHIDRRISAPGDIGHKALAVNLSDLAAMGAEPRWALLSLVLPGTWLAAEVEALVDGLAALARTAGISVVGGNITASPGPLVVDVTAIGSVHPRRVLTRGGGRPGDDLYVSGALGAGRAGLAALRAAVADGRDPSAAPCGAWYRRPAPRVRLGRALARNRAARAAMDLSDGLADAVRQVAEASGCGARIDADALPIDPAARAFWEGRGQDPVAEAVAGGDDYELLVAVPPRWRGRLRAARHQVAEPALTKIGVLTKERGVELERGGRRDELPRGYEHYRD